MADRIAVMRDGIIEQHARPQEIYHHPCNRFVADFIGKSNFIEGVYRSDKQAYVLPSGKELFVDNVCEVAGGSSAGQEKLIVRPEYLRMTAFGKSPVGFANSLSAVVKDVTFLGELTLYTVDMGMDGTLQLSVYGYVQQYGIGERVDIYWDRSVGQLLSI